MNDDGAKRRREYKKNWMRASRARKRKNRSPDPVSSDSSSEEELSEFIQFDNEHHQTSPTTTGELSPVHLESDLCDDSIIWDQIDNHISYSSDEDIDWFESGDDYAKEPVRDKLSKWVNENNINHSATDSLLKLLRDAGHSELPLRARSLLKTTREVNVQRKSGMDYFYFGLKEELLKQIQKYPISKRNALTVLFLCFNIDGLPIFKSTNTALWPVLCAVRNLTPPKVFPVAVTCGTSKPQNLDFIQDLIDELNEILVDGLVDGEKTYEIKVKCVVCDAPAKAMVKGTKQFSGYYGCDKCAQRGEWMGRITYPQVRNVPMRTDTSFRQRTNVEHHNAHSPFCDLPIDMIKTFPMDYMHQVCLGVMKRLILVWLRGKKENRISAQQANAVSLKLLSLQRYIPNIFVRKPRSLEDIDKWKATEFRQFLLYTGKVALKGILPTPYYKHFLVLNVAISILVNERLTTEYSQYAHGLLLYFVERARELYGPEFLVYNIHSLVHLVADAEENGSLEACSAFIFENYLQEMKKIVRSGRQPLVQIVKRMKEKQNTDIIMPIERRAISTMTSNNVFMLSSSSFCQVIERSANPINEQDAKYLCRVYKRLEPLFNEPCNASIIGAFTANVQYTQMKIIPATQLQKRAIMIELDRRKPIFQAVLHDF